MSGNLYELIQGRIADREKTFIETGQGAICSYGAFDQRSAQYAQALTELGVEPGDRVAVQVDKSVEAILLYLGCLRAGAVYLPLNTGYTAAEIEYFLGDAKPRVAVCQPGALESFGSVAGSVSVPHVETLGADGKGSIADKAGSQDGDFGIVDRSQDDLAAILYTSGTTGRSKGAMLTHGNLTSNALTLCDYWQFSSKDVLLHALPIFHTHGLFVATNVVLLSGGSMLFLPGFDISDILRLLPRASAMMGVPTFYTRLLGSEDFTRDLVSHIRLFVSGSAPLSPETHKEFQERTGHAILERYGMTETNMNTSNPYDGDRRAGTVGFPLPGIEIRVADPDTGRELPQGDVGVVEIRGPNVFKGYWQMPEKTAAEFREDGFFISGDLGRVDETGYLSIVGREKDLIISGGFNVYPAEVEAALDAVEGIAESAVVGLPHADFGEGVTAFVVPSGDGGVDEADVRNLLVSTLAKYKIPKRVISLDTLPRNAMGKVQKKALRETHAGLYQ